MLQLGNLAYGEWDWCWRVKLDIRPYQKAHPYAISRQHPQENLSCLWYGSCREDATVLIFYLDFVYPWQTYSLARLIFSIIAGLTDRLTDCANISDFLQHHSRFLSLLRANFYRSSWQVTENVTVTMVRMTSHFIYTSVTASVTSKQHCWHSTIAKHRQL